MVVEQTTVSTFCELAFNKTKVIATFRRVLKHAEQADYFCYEWGIFSACTAAEAAAAAAVDDDVKDCDDKRKSAR